MSSQDAPRQPSAETVARQRALIRYLSLGAIVVCPMLIALPPRKMDGFTVLALASTGMSGDYLVGDYTGRSLVDRAKYSASGFMASEVEKRRLEKTKKVGEVLEGAMGSKAGGGKEEWKVQRDERERKAMEEGKGYGGLIMDQIWDVWTWGKGAGK